MPNCQCEACIFERDHPGEIWQGDDADDDYDYEDEVWGLDDKVDMSNPIFQPKKPPEEFLGTWRSIEFELIFKSREFLDEFVIWTKDNESICGGVSYSKLITVKSDGSIIPKNPYGGEAGKEIIVSFRVGEDKIVRDVCKFLKTRAYVNRSCGTHVHFDMRGFDKEKVQLFGKRLAQSVPMLKEILPKSRKHNQFCGVDINSIDEKGADWASRSKRYAFVNMMAYNIHKTIEVRAHSGTINASKILNWIGLCETIMLSEVPLIVKHKKPKVKLAEVIPADEEPIPAPVAITKSSPVDQLVETYKLPNKLKKYVIKRYEAVNKTEDDEDSNEEAPAIV